VGKVCRSAKDHCVPSADNDYCPHVLKHRVLLGYSVILILVKALAIVIPIALPAASLYSSAITNANIFSLTNTARAAAGLPLLAVNGLLEQAAQAKANDMLAGQYFAHQSPDGRMPWNFIRGTGYDYRHAGENLAVHFQQAEDVQAGWMASPTHRANILDNRYQEIGVGVSSGQFDGVPTVFVVQMFGTPKEGIAPTPAAPPAPAPVVETPTIEPPAPIIETPTPAPVSPTPTPNPTPAPVVEAVTTPAVVAPAPVVTIAPPEKEIISAPNTETIAPPAPIAIAPTIDADSASIAPTATGYRISVAAKNATHVSVALGGTSAGLEADPAGTGVWYGVINHPQALQQGGALTALAVGEHGQAASTVLATLTPAPEPQDLYLFNQETRVSPKVFGVVDLGNFDDKAKRFYAYMSVFLGAILLAGLSLRFHLRHPSVVAHATGVLALTLLLLFV
jgi:hypothetical protein